VKGTETIKQEIKTKEKGLERRSVCWVTNKRCCWWGERRSLTAVGTE